MAALPTDIWKHIVHREGLTQIKGFEELFILLDTDSGADHLRRLVVDYFNQSPYLREHLREPSFTP